MVKARRPYKVGVERRKLIISIAQEIFSTEGFQATSMESIARAANMSPSSLKHYYPTKHHILAAIVDQRLTEFDQPDAIAEDTDVYAWLNNMCRAHLDMMRNPSYTELSILALAEATDPSSPFHDIMHKHYRRGLIFGSVVLRACQNRGEVRADVDPDETAAFVMAMPNGLQQAWLLQDRNTDLAALSNKWLVLLARSIITPEHLDDERLNALAAPQE